MITSMITDHMPCCSGPAQTCPRPQCPSANSSVRTVLPKFGTPKVDLWMTLKYWASTFFAGWYVNFGIPSSKI